MNQLNIIKTVLIALIANSFMSGAWANDLVMVSRGNQNVYAIVYKTETDAVEDKPGIYALERRTGKLIPVIYGDVLNVNRAFNGIIADLQFRGGVHDSAESFAVVDNRIVLFNRNMTTGATKAKAPIVLGGDKFKLIDPSIGLPFANDILVTDLDQVSIFQMDDHVSVQDFPNGARFFIMSVKHPSPYGTGVTFAFVVEGPTQSSTPTKIFRNSGHILNYDFLDETELRRLMLNQGYGWQGGLVSTNLIQSHRAKFLPNPHNSPLVRKWMAHLKESAAYFGPGGAKGIRSRDTPQFLSKGIPHYNFFTERVLYDTIPVHALERESQTSLYQVFDPRGEDRWYVDNLGEVFFDPRVNSEKKARAGVAFVQAHPDKKGVKSGRVSYDTRTGYSTRQISSKDSDMRQSEFIISLGSSSLLLLRGTNGNLIELPVDQVSLDDTRKLEIIHEIQHFSREVGSVHFIFISVVKKTGAKALHLVSASEDGGKLNVNYAVDLGKMVMTREELQLRTYFSQDEKTPGIYIDLVTPVMGASKYAKSLTGSKDVSGVSLHDNAKVTKYRYIHPTDDKKRQGTVFRRVAKYQEVIEGNGLLYVQFGSNSAQNANTVLSGMYPDYKDSITLTSDDGMLSTPVVQEEDRQSTKRKFIRGKPIFYDRRSKRHTLDVMQFKMKGPADNFDLSVVPFVENIKADPTEVNGFKALIFLASTGPGSKDTPSWFEVVDIPGYYPDLLGAQIVKGVLGSDNDFNILFLFGKDGGSQHRGVYVVSGKVEGKQLNGDYRPEGELYHTGAWLHKNFVAPAEIALRIKSDATGKLYWLDDPEEDIHSTKFRVRKLSNPAKFININRPEDGVRVQLRMDEAIEPSTTNSTMASKWSVVYSGELKTRFPWFKEYVAGLEKIEDEKKNNTKKGKKGATKKFVPYYGVEDDMDYWDETGPSKDWLKHHVPSSPHFVRFLEAFARKSEEAVEDGQGHKRQIVLVEEKMREVFLNDMMVLLTEGNGPFSIEFKKRQKFGFYTVSPTSTVEESKEEIEGIRDAQGSKKVLLFTTLNEMNTASNFESEKRDHLDDDDDRERKESHSRWLFLATDGEKNDRARIRSNLKPTDPLFPTLIVGTPEEFAQAKAANPFEEKIGVFDAFDVNTEFLTGKWKQWPPGSRYATTEIKSHAATPVTEEEYRVFPGLEQLFTSGAEGELEGKQKVIIVSKELKPLIHKLIMTRWATGRKELAGAWNHSNPDLLFYQLDGDRGENTQSVIFDNFEAMRGGATHSNVVLYADMEHIRNIGRAFNTESRADFQIRNPIRKRAEEGIIHTVADVHVETSPVEDPNIILVNDEIDELRASLDELDRDDPDERQEIKEISKKIKELEGRLSELETGLDMKSGRTNPHTLYLIASEGQQIQPSSKKGWNLRDAVDRRISTVIISTQDEWDAMDQELGFEAPFFDHNEHFEFVKLSAPSDEVKFELVRSLFDRPDIRTMEYQFDVEIKLENGDVEFLDQETAQRQLITHFVNRVAHTAITEGMEHTQAFIRAFAELRRNLVEDVYLRRNRRLNRNYLERLLFKIFPLHIGLENLEPDDPLRKLLDVPEAARQLQKLGYHGSMELKERTLNTVLNQTRGGDAGRPIPNSQIFFGGTSSGKTFLFKMKMKLLGLKEYDPSKANNEEAGYIIIHAGSLVEGDATEIVDGKLSVGEAIRQIRDLIAQPNGHRAHILIDDAHKSPSKMIHQQILAFVQELFEAPNGFLRVARKGAKNGDIKEVPVRNLGLYMTVNPTMNRDQLKRYVGDSSDLRHHVLAALAIHGIDMEDSVLARWADIIDLNQFPRGAKVPALVEKVRSASAPSRYTVLVDSGAIDGLVERFPDANARDFLASAASALTTIPPTSDPAPLYIVTPKSSRQPGFEGPEGGTFQSRGRKGFLTSGEISEAVKKITQVDPIFANEPESIFRLLSFLISNFRMQMFNNIVLSAQNGDELRLDSSGQSTVLKKQFVLALMNHILKNQVLPLREVRISGADFGFLSDTELRDLVELHLEHRKNGEGKKDYFPFEIGSSDRISNFDTDGFFNGRAIAERHAKSRRDIINESMKRIEGILSRVLKTYARLGDRELRSVLTWSPEQVGQWFDDLSADEPNQLVKRFSLELVQEFSQFIDQFNNPDLVDFKGEQPPEHFNFYDYGALFAYMIDGAILRQPWGAVSKLTMDVTTVASNDFGLGQKPHFIKWAYESPHSPLSIATADFLNETFATDLRDKARMDGLLDGFMRRCEVSLRKKGSGGKP